MLPTVPDAVCVSEGGRFRASIAQIGTSLLGSGAIATLALACLVFTTGMKTPSPGLPSAAVSSGVDATTGGEWVPETNRLHWIKNVVDEPIRSRPVALDTFDSLTPSQAQVRSSIC